MDKKLTFTGGEPAINWDDLNRDETANRAALFGIMKAFNIGTNENFIISGCEATVDTGVDVDVTAGYIFLNGEILQVDAQTVVNGGTLDLYKYTKEVTYDPNGDKTYNDSTARQTWQKNRGKVEAATAPILGTELDVVSGDRLVDKISYYHRNKYHLFVDASSYSVAEGVYYIEIPSGVTSGTITLPDPSLFAGQEILVMSTGGNGVDVDQFDTTLLQTMATDKAMKVACNGTKWDRILYSDRPLACPFIYINGVFYDEILKNNIFESNYKEDSIDVTSVVKSGYNELWLTEEKEEITFIDYLDVVVDGKLYDRLFNSKRILNKGDKFEFSFDLKEYNKVELFAKGYYLPT